MSSNELVVPLADARDVLGVAIALPLASLILVSLRLWTRYRQRNQEIGADDWTNVAALVFVLAMGVDLIIGVAKGAIGYPTREDFVPGEDPGYTILTSISPHQRATELTDFIIIVTMIPANGFIKLSALLLYRRLFVVNRGTIFDIVSKVTIIICLVWTVSFEFATIFGCGLSPDKTWHSLAEIASCNTNTRLDALMISDLLTDLLVWLLPIPLIWTLNMKVSRKMSASAILLLAAVSLAAAIVRLIIQREITTGGYAAHADVDLTLTTLLYWSMIESGLALIASCLPIVHNLINHQKVNTSVATVQNTFSLKTFPTSWKRAQDPSRGSSVDLTARQDPYRNIGNDSVMERALRSPRDKYEIRQEERECYSAV